MADKYLLFSLEEENSKKLGEVISNPTCKKILSILSEKELSVSEIANELQIPLNTTDYNIKNMLKAGLIEKANKWWSVKGKKIDTYTIANKLIVISPKKSLTSKVKSILPALIIIGFLTIFLANYYSQEKMNNLQNIQDTQISQEALKVASSEMAYNNEEKYTISTPSLISREPWPWFLAGALLTLAILLSLNWKKL
jgi:predicted transcriptional regulator